MGKARKRSTFSSREQRTMSPVPVSTSISMTDSCGRPLRKLVDSTPMPETAPPSVMVFSWGMTRGARWKGRVASTSCSYVHIPWTSAVLATGSMAMTPPRPLTSRPAPGSTRLRNKFDVRLARRTRSPAGTCRKLASRVSTPWLCACQPTGVTRSPSTLRTPARDLARPSDTLMYRTIDPSSGLRAAGERA